MNLDDHQADPSMERFRQYLLLVARLQLGKSFRGKLDASDVVQQTLLEAHIKRQDFRGSTEEERLAWLRRILVNNLADEIRRLRRAKRGPEVQLSIDAADESSLHWQASLAAEQSSPSQKAEQNERLLQLADALAALPPSQQEAVVLHHLQGMSLAESAKHMGKSEPAVAGLLHRALQKLREQLQDREEP